MKSRIILFIVAYAIWCALNWAPDRQHLIAGVPVAFLVAWITGDLFVGRVRVLMNPKRYVLFLFWYLPVFFWEVIKANIDVACRVVQPKVPLNPGIVKVHTTLKSDTALTFLANSITLTPGTLSVDIDKEKNSLYVHWIDVKAKDIKGATKVIVERFEHILRKIFD